MDNNRFFKFLWRVNALMLFCVALLALVTIVSAFSGDVFSGNSSDKPPVQIDIDNQVRLSVQDLEIRKTSVHLSSDLVYFELGKHDNPGGFKSYAQYVIYNVGIHSLASGKTQWVFPTNNQQIDTSEHFHKTEVLENGETKNTFVGHLFSSLTTDKDGNVRRDVWVSDVYGNGLQKILSDVSGKPDIWYFGDNRTKISFETKRGIDLVAFDVFTREIGETVTVQPPQ